jgi:hypothetical protein
MIDVKTNASLPINVETGATVQSEIRETYRNVTAVVVSQDFYDQAILPIHKVMTLNKGLKTTLGLADGMVHHVAAKNGRGSGWTSIFIPRGDEMLVALHHSMLSVSGGRIRSEVEARWHAFGQPRKQIDAATAP